MISFRSLADDVPDRLHRFLMPLENNAMTESLAVASAKIAIVEMIRGGITSAVDMYYHEAAIAKTASHMGFRLWAGETVLDAPHPGAASFDESLARCDELCSMNDPLVTPLIAPHAPYSLSERNLERSFSYAESHGIMWTMHLQELPMEMSLFKERHSMSPIAWMDDEGLLSSNLIAAHLLLASDDDIMRLAENDVRVVNCPGSNAKAAKGVARIPEMAEAAKILNQHIKDYRINVKAQLDKETGLLQNFIADLQEKYAEQVETLSLTALVTKMQAANEKVNELIQQRADEYAMRTVGATKQARVKVDEAYRNLILVINAYMLMEDDNADYIAFAKHQNEEIKRIKQQVLGQTSGNKKPDEGGDEPTPEPTHEITAFYPKEGANPDKPLEFPRNKPAVLEGKGLKLVDSPEGKKAQLVLINYVEQRMPHEDSALLLNTDEKIEFTMMYDAAEGQYNFQIETYPDGTEEAVIIKYPETITLV